MAVAELDRESLATVKEESFWGVVWKRFRKHKLAVGEAHCHHIGLHPCFCGAVIHRHQ
jgi:hypothetical protein